jgi:hypothetical protein
MKELLNAIVARLKGKIPALRYVDENWGQLDNYKEQPVKFPCALIDMSVDSWRNLGNSVQDGEVTVNITVAVNRLKPKLPTDSAQNIPFEIYGIMDAVFAALHGWAATPSAGKLTRTETGSVSTRDGVKGCTLSFRVRLLDEGARPHQQSVHVNDLTINTNAL